MDNPKQEIKDFGQTIREMEGMKPGFVSNVMYAMQILSDAQVVLERGNTEATRQYISKAKYFLARELESGNSPIINSSGDAYVR